MDLKQPCSFSLAGFPEFTLRRISACCFRLFRPSTPQANVRTSHLPPDSPDISSSQESRHCRRMNVKQPRGVSGGFGALGYHRNDLILLIWSEFWPSPSNSALLTGSV